MNVTAQQIAEKAIEGKWNRIVPFEGSGNVVIDGIGPCLGIILYNQDQQKGLWGHFTQPIFYSDQQLREYKSDDREFSTLEDFLNYAKSAQLTKGNWALFATGMSPNPIASQIRPGQAIKIINSVVASRARVKELLIEEFPLVNINLELIEELCIGSKMTFEPETSSINITRIRLYHKEFTIESFYSQWLKRNRRI